MRPSSNNDLATMSMMLKSAEPASSVRGSALGGMLLHSIDYPCKKGSTFGTIADAYVTSYVKQLKGKKFTFILYCGI